MAFSLRLRPSLVLASILLVAGGAQAQTAANPTPSPAHLRWSEALAAFAQADKSQAPQPGGVVFVGSSSIRMWSKLQQDFKDVPGVVNRGFGGSTMKDCSLLARELVLPYRPSQIVVYAGENDLAEGRTPAEVLASFRSFVEAVRSEMPDVRIVYVSVKPSPLRINLIGKVRETNRLMADYVGSETNMGFVDVFSAMLDASGAVRAELFGPDRLHMNDQGYGLWRQVLASHVKRAVAPFIPWEASADASR